MNLYLKYRPKSFDAIVGNEQTVHTIQEMLSNKNNCPHSFLLNGPKGCGKTTIARLITDNLNCRDSDLKEIDIADYRGIDTVREIRRESNYSPMKSSCRVWIMDEAHQFTKDAQNGLLKILEDTPKHVYFILCTTDPQKLLPTVIDRCSKFEVRPINETQMFRLLRKIVRAEGKNLQKLVYEQITQDSLGMPRAALQILDQVLRTSPEKQLEIAKQSAEQQNQSIELCRALLQKSGWKKVRNILNGLKGQEPESIRRHILSYCQSVLLKEDNELGGRVMEEFLEPFFTLGFAGLVYACYSIIKN